MPKGTSLGEFEHLVLLAVFRLGADAYGMRVRQEIAQRTGRDVSIGAVYATLERLVGKGLLAIDLGAPTPQRGGRAKRSMHLTGLGVAALNRTHEDLAHMLEGMPFPVQGSFR